MESQNSETDTKIEYYYAKLKEMGYLPGPVKCDWGNIEFRLKVVNNYKESKICYRCSNYKCKKRFNVRTNSFFAEFPQIRLLTISEVIKSILCWSI